MKKTLKYATSLAMIAALVVGVVVSASVAIGGDSGSEAVDLQSKGQNEAKSCEDACADVSVDVEVDVSVDISVECCEDVCEEPCDDPCVDTPCIDAILECAERGDEIHIVFENQPSCFVLVVAGSRPVEQDQAAEGLSRIRSLAGQLEGTLEIASRCGYDHALVLSFPKAGELDPGEPKETSSGG